MTLPSKKESRSCFRMMILLPILAYRKAAQAIRSLSFRSEMLRYSLASNTDILTGGLERIHVAVIGFVMRTCIRPSCQNRPLSGCCRERLFQPNFRRSAHLGYYLRTAFNSLERVSKSAFSRFS